jgi:hypothetical protein
MAIPNKLYNKYNQIGNYRYNEQKGQFKYMENIQSFLGRNQRLRFGSNTKYVPSELT